MFKNFWNNSLSSTSHQPAKSDCQALASQNAGHSVPKNTDATVGHYWPSRIEWNPDDHRSAFIRAIDGQWPRVYLKILSRDELVNKLSHNDTLHRSDDSWEQKRKIIEGCQDRLPKKYSGVERWLKEPGEMDEKLKALDLGLTCRISAIWVGPGSSELLDRSQVEGETLVPFVKDLDVVIPKDLNLKAGGVGKAAAANIERGPWYGYAEFKGLRLSQPGRYLLFADILDREGNELPDHHVCFVQTEDLMLFRHVCHRRIEVNVLPKGTKGNEAPSDAWYQAHESKFDSNM